jgi:hypothetical protein
MSELILMGIKELINEGNAGAISYRSDTGIFHKRGELHKEWDILVYQQYYDLWDIQ